MTDTAMKAMERAHEWRPFDKSAGQKHTDLLPWDVSEEHRGQREHEMLVLESRRRAGDDLGESDRSRLEEFLRFLQDEDRIVAYSPKSGFHCLPRPRSIVWPIPLLED